MLTANAQGSRQCSTVRDKLLVFSCIIKKTGIGFNWKCTSKKSLKQIKQAANLSANYSNYTDAANLHIALMPQPIRYIDIYL